MLALLTGAGFLAFGYLFGGGNLSVYDGPGAFLLRTTFISSTGRWARRWLCLLAINCLRMWRYTMRGDRHAPVSLSHVCAPSAAAPLHFLTQKRYRECEDKRPWATHLVLMLSYLTMLVLIMFFLKEMQSGPQVNWYVHSFGYLASVGLVVTVTLGLHGRAEEGRHITATRTSPTGYSRS